MDTAMENRILLWVLGVLYLILSGLAVKAYTGFIKRLDQQSATMTLLNNDVIALKTEVMNLREWRHKQANELHAATLMEIKALHARALEVSMREKEKREGDT